MMKTCSIKSVYEAVVRMRGIDPNTADIGEGERILICDWINERVVEGWEAEFWPELMVVERRQYRASWNEEVNYSTGDEVYYEDADGEGGYYVSLADVNVGHIPGADGSDDFWADVGDDFVRSIDFQQSGETVIGGADEMKCVYDRDPRVYPDTKPLENIEVFGERILVKTRTAPLRPWVMFRPEPRQFSLKAWSAETGYAIADLVYVADTGHTYIALKPSTNKNPVSETEYWMPVEFPLFLKRYVIHAVNADQMTEDEGRYKEEGKADKKLENLRQRKVDQVKVRKAVWVC